MPIVPRISREVLVTETSEGKAAKLAVQWARGGILDWTDPSMSSPLIWSS